MNNIDQMKLANSISLKIMKADLPTDGRCVITISMEDGKATNVDVRNVKAKKIKEG